MRPGKDHRAGGAGVPFGAVPVANPRTKSGCVDPGLPAELGNTAVRVAVAPGATFTAAVEEDKSPPPRIPTTGAMLFAVMSPVFVTEMVTV